MFRLRAQGEVEVEDEEVFVNSADMEIWSPTSLTYYGPVTRNVLITGAVTSQTANAITSQLLQLDAIDEEAPIQVTVNTEGGDVVQALAMYDVMRAIRAPIITVVQGEASSAGLMLMQGGDIRVAYPNSRLFYHEVITQSLSSSTALSEENYRLYEWAQSTMKQIIQKRAKINKTKWKRHFDARCQAAYFTAQEAMELKLIDHVIKYQRKPKIHLEVE